MAEPSDAPEEELDWWPDATDDSLTPRYTPSGVEYYVEPDGSIFLGCTSVPTLEDWTT